MLELLDRQKRLTVNQWKIIATANLSDLLDFFDFYLIGYALAFILKEWHLTYGESALILLASGVGAVPGAFFWWWMADKIGRRIHRDNDQCRDRHRHSGVDPGPGGLGRRLAVSGIFPLLRRDR